LFGLFNTIKSASQSRKLFKVSGSFYGPSHRKQYMIHKWN